MNGDPMSSSTFSFTDMVDYYHPSEDDGESIELGVQPLSLQSSPTSAPPSLMTPYSPLPDQPTAASQEPAEPLIPLTTSIGPATTPSRQPSSGTPVRPHTDDVRPTDGQGPMPKNSTSQADPVHPQKPNKAVVDALDDRHLFWVLLDYARYRSWKKKLLTALLMISSAYVFFDLLFLGNIQRWIFHLLQWMERNPNLAVVGFIVLFTVSTLVFVPPYLLVFGAGYLFANIQGTAAGIFSATFACYVGTCCGALLAFYRSRYMMRDLVELFARRYPLARALDRAVTRNGFRVMLLLRLCPLIPFNGLNYIGGITAISWEDYTFSLIGVLPSQIALVAMGATANSLAQASNLPEGSQGFYIVHVIFLAAGVGFFIIAVAITAYFAHKELAREYGLSYDAPLREDWHREDWLHDGTTTTNTNTMTASSSTTPLAEPHHLTTGHGSTKPSYQPGVDDEEWFWLWT